MGDPQPPERLTWSEEHAPKALVSRYENSAVEGERKFAEVLKRALALLEWSRTSSKTISNLEKRIEVLQGKQVCSKCERALGGFFARVCYECLRRENGGTSTNRT